MLIHNLVILVGTAYVVFGLDRSPFWFVIAMLFVVYRRGCLECKKRKEAPREG